MYIFAVQAVSFQKTPTALWRLSKREAKDNSGDIMFSKQVKDCGTYEGRQRYGWIILYHVSGMLWDIATG